MTTEIRCASTAYRLLNGIFCIYKNPQTKITATKAILRQSLADDLNEYEPRPLKQRVVIEGSVRDESLSVGLKDSYADHPLVVGPRYTKKDFLITVVNDIGFYSSGLMVVGIGGKGLTLGQELTRSNFLKVYELKCRLGRSTSDFYETGSTIEKSTYNHVTREKLSFIISKELRSQKKMMFRTAGIDMHSQDAYEMAAAGPFRPVGHKTSPVLYGLKITEFKRPYFSLMMSVINDDPFFMGFLINNLGLMLKTNAHITHVRCLRYGHFRVDNALLDKHWTVEHVINNIIANEPNVTEDKISPYIPNLINSKDTNPDNFFDHLNKNQDRFEIIDKPIA